MNRSTRRVISVMLVAVVLYGAAAFYNGIGKITESLHHYAWWTFAAACALAFLNYVLRFLKWEYYLAVLGIRGIPKGESFLTFLSGFVLTVTPGKVGEVFKSLILFQLREVPIQRTAPIVVAERVTDLIGVIVLIAVGSVSFKGGVIWAALGAAVVIALLVFVSTPALSRRLLDLLPKLPGALGRIAGRVVPKIEEALDNVRVLTTPGRLVLPTVLSILAWACECIGLWVIVGGFGEALPGLPFTAFVYATATLAGALIPVPGGLGVTDGLIKEQLARLGGLAEGTAFASMLLVRFATLWFAVLVGFVALGILRAIRPGLAGQEASAPVPMGAGASSDEAPVEEAGGAG
ncbi:MAG: lysylphosphatidylglycerol synthase transmembrane domain-containing protein [Minicystis sp.]